MARLMAGCQGQRGGATRLGGVSSGARAFCRGYGAGVDISGGANSEDSDEFRITMNGGSRAASNPVCLGSVCDTPEGPKFFPSEFVKKLVLEGQKNA